MTLFLPIRESSSKAESKSVVTYGISAYKNNKKVASVSNVSPKFFFVVSLCFKFNILKLSPLHLRDVLNDML